MESPSFNTHSCSNIADIANRVVQELHNDDEFKDLICFSDDDDELNEDEENTQQDEFEFPLMFTDSSLTDNIIYNDQVSPRYPLFDRSLLLNLDTNLSNPNDSKPAPTLASAPISIPVPVSVPTPAPAPALAPAPVPVVTPTLTLTTPVKVSASAPTPTLLTTSIVTPATNPDPASPPSTRLSLSKLFSEDRDSTQSSSTLVLESNDFNTISPETYCVWKPHEQDQHRPPIKHHSRGKHKKSNSISISEDTSSKRWKVRDLLKRSYSDDSKHTSSSSVVDFSSPHKPKTGKDGSVVVVLPPISPKPSNEKMKKPEKALKTTASSMGGGCHKPENKTPAAYKAKIGNIRLPAFLPYRQDQHQVDAFANHTNNGPSKHIYRY